MNFILNFLRLVYLFFARDQNNEDRSDDSDINTDSECDASMSKDSGVGVQPNVSTVTPIKQVFVKPLKFDNTKWRGRGYYLNHSSDKYSVNNEAPLHDLKFQNVTPLQKLKPHQNMTPYSNYEDLHEDEAEHRFSAPLSLQDIRQHINDQA